MPYRIHRIAARASVWLPLALGCCSCSDAISGEGSADQRQPIVGGEATATCAWPTTVAFSSLGCTGTLVHPRLITLAAHCLEGKPTPKEVLFSDVEDRDGPGQRVAIESCRSRSWSQDREDIAYCVLDEAVDYSIIPIMYGCELELLQPGEQAILVGFGYIDATTPSPGSRKRWTEAPIVEVRESTIDVGESGHANCFGDSGGPAFFQMPDGSWRLFGVTSTTYDVDDVSCTREGTWTLTPHYVPWIEETSGLDVTPCFDTQGAWAPGPECDRVPLNPEAANGSWARSCHETELLSGPLSSCGEPLLPPTGGGGMSGAGGQSAAGSVGFGGLGGAGAAGIAGQAASSSAGVGGAGGGTLETGGGGGAAGGAQPSSQGGIAGGGATGVNTAGASSTSALDGYGSNEPVLGECACRAAHGRAGGRAAATLLGLMLLTQRRRRRTAERIRRHRSTSS